MSSRYVKTKYEITDGYGTIEEKTLYALHNGTTDTVSYYDEDGTWLFTVEDTIDNNLFEAISRLWNPVNIKGEIKEPDTVQRMTKEDIEKVNKFKL